MPAGFDLNCMSGTKSGMVPKSGVLEWKDTGSSGSSGRADKEVVLPSMSMTSWSSWSFTSGWMRS